MQHADGEVLEARTAVEAVCARHGLHRSDLQEHADLLGFDIGTIDDDAAHIKQVQCISPPQLPHAWYELRQISLTSIVELYRLRGRYKGAVP